MPSTDPIVQVGDPVLRATAAPVGPKDFGSPKLLALIHKMKKLLAAEEYGVAIAAPQAGASLRLFVVAGRAFADPQDDAEETEVPPDRVFINPTLSRLSREVAEMSEGCLSVRNKYGSVVRHAKASIKAQDEHGKPFTYNATGLVAQIFQHECDHLDGILYTDKAMRLEEDQDYGAARKKIRTNTQPHGN